MNATLEGSATRGESRIDPRLKRKILLGITIFVILVVSAVITYRVIFDAGVVYARAELGASLESQNWAILQVTNEEGATHAFLVQVDSIDQYMKSAGSVLEIYGKTTNQDLSFLAQGE